MARKRKWGGLVAGFNAGYDTVGKVMQDRDMAAAANEKQAEDTGFTVEQGEQLEALANAKDENGNAFYNVNATEDGKYQVTPNKEVFEARGASADLTDATANVDPGKRFTFQGNARDTAFTEAEQDRGRMQAMAGVYSKHGDPVKAMAMRQQAGQLEMQGIQKQAAEQGLALGKLQIQGAERANADGERQDVVRNELSQAAQAQEAAAKNSGNYGSFQSNMAKVVADKGIEGMVRENAGPNASESEIQQAINAYRQSLGDAQSNQNAASMQELYKHQGQIWGGVGGDPVKAAAAYKMAEAEGMPKVIEALKANDVDGANKIWNSSGQGKGIITEIGNDGKGNLLAKVVDPFSGKTQHVNVSDMERQLLSLRDQLGMKKDEANIAQSEAAIRQGDARLAEDRRHNKASEGSDNTAKLPAVAATAEWMVKSGVAPDRKAAYSMLSTSKSSSRTEFVADLTGKIISSGGGMVKAPDAYKQAQEIAGALFPEDGAAKPAAAKVGERRKFPDGIKEWDGKNWNAEK